MLFLLLFTALASNAQQSSTPSLILGNPAPPLRVQQWIKGEPIKEFKEGHVYVLEFWATWCGPCIAAVPHLSKLARQYKGKATFIGVDALEWTIKSPKSIPQVKAFVDSLGHRMDYSVAIEARNVTVADWMDAADVQGIPSTFVIDGKGRLAWIGHPLELDEVLAQIVDDKWDVKDALLKRDEFKRLADMDDSYRDQLNSYVGNANKFDLGKPDSALILIQQIVNKEPKLKFAPTIAIHTFSALLKTDPKKAYEYGREMLITPSILSIDYSSITYPIEWYAEKTNLITLPPEFYELGADAYGAKVDKTVSLSAKLPQIYLNKLPQTYMKMAEWYWRAKKTDKAIQAAQKAIEAMTHAQEN